MSEKDKKRFEFQKKMIARQSEQIELLELQIDELKKECEEKDEMINSIVPLRNELAQNISEVKKYKEEYKRSIEEVKKMKRILNEDVYKGKWNIVKFLIK